MTMFPIPEGALKRHTAILGMTGSGKSSTGRTIVEHVVAEGHRVCILDTLKSDWWGITSSGNGKKPGLPFKILGGPRGHLNLHSSAGKTIGQLVGTGKLLLSIIDMADFEPGGLQRFFIDFAPALMKSIKGVVYLVIEEAHEVAPKERAGFSGENMTIHYAKKLGTGSRTKGIRLIVATQRVQALHNAVLGSCETLIAHRIGFADDQTPVLKWMQAKIGKDNTKTVETELANLPDGEAFIASGAPVKIFERKKFPLFKTFDNTKTPDGADADIEIKTAPVDLDALRSIIGAAAAEAEANDPKALKGVIAKKDAEIAALKRDASLAAQPAAPDAATVAEIERRAFKAGFDEASTQGAIQINDIIKDASEFFDSSAREFAQAFGQRRPKFILDVKYSNVPKSVPPAVKQIPAGAPRHSAKPSPAAGGEGSYSTALLNALSALAELRALGVHQPTREMVAAMAKYSNIQSRPIRDAFARSLDEGLMSSPSKGRVSITDAGISLVGIPSAPPSTADMRDRIAKAIGSAAGNVLTQLIAAYPRAVSRVELAAALNYSNIQSRPIRDAFSKLLDTGFAEAPEPGFLVATKALFP